MIIDDTCACTYEILFGGLAIICNSEVLTDLIFLLNIPLRYTFTHCCVCVLCVQVHMCEYDLTYINTNICMHNCRRMGGWQQLLSILGFEAVSLTELGDYCFDWVGCPVSSRIFLISISPVLGLTQFWGHSLSKYAFMARPLWTEPPHQTL